ncbi:MAG: ParB N-terminal domain-containing protein [Thermoplasmatota archaeon]
MKKAINDIKIPEGRRNIGDIDSLVESIREIGLLNPICINNDNMLIAGARRLEACKVLGWREIECNVLSMDDMKLDLVEIDENLIRLELTVLERAEQLKMRKEIYDMLYPESKSTLKGGRIHGNPMRGAVPAPQTFTKDASKKIGMAQRTIQSDIQIATGLDDDVKEQIRDTPLADRKEDLLKLARMDKETQKKNSI